jgi:hypothetical protein
MPLSRSFARQLRAMLPLVALFAVGAASTAHQATPGITFKIRTQLRNNRVPAKQKPDSVAIKRREAEAAARAAADIDVGGDLAAPQTRGAPTGGNNILMMTGSFIKGMGRMDVQGVVGNPELAATQAALFTDTSSTVIDDVEKS